MKIKKKIKIGGIVVLLYILLGALIPFMYQPKVGKDITEQYSTDRFYQTGFSTDRAAIVESSIEALDTRIAMFEKAKERIVLSTFDIRQGESCRDIFASLLVAADRGVKVQILVDGLYGNLHMGIEPIFYAVGSHENVEIQFYNTPNLLFPWTINGRMHDKYILIDNQFLLLGGRNTFDYFLGEYDKKNLSYDREILIYNTAYQEADQMHQVSDTKDSVLQSGSVIDDMYSYFDTIWDSKPCKNVYEKPPFWLDKQKIEQERNLLWKRYETKKKKKSELFDGSIDYEKSTVAIHKASLISNPIHIFAKQPYVWYEIMQLAAESKERVYLHTPYAVFSRAMYQDIKKLVKEEKKNVIMQINSTAVGDNIMASSDYTFNKKKLLKTGMQIYEFQGAHSSHGKSVLFDNNLSLIGSYNLDMRSTYVDTEVALVIHGEEFNQLLEEKIMAMEKQSLRVDTDGSYIKNEQVKEVKLSLKKKILFSITSIVFQLFRYLI